MAHGGERSWWCEAVDVDARVRLSSHASMQSEGRFRATARAERA
jgi:hypothetical protein